MSTLLSAAMAIGRVVLAILREILHACYIGPTPALIVFPIDIFSIDTF